MTEDLTKKLLKYALILDIRISDGSQEYYQQLGMEFRWEERGKLQANKKALDNLYQEFPELKPLVEAEVARKKEQEKSGVYE